MLYLTQNKHQANPLIHTFINFSPYLFKIRIGSYAKSAVETCIFCFGSSIQDRIFAHQYSVVFFQYHWLLSFPLSLVHRQGTWQTDKLHQSLIVFLDFAVFFKSPPTNKEIPNRQNLPNKIAIFLLFFFLLLIAKISTKKKKWIRQKTIKR